jgi:hypothetical protein
MIPVYGHRYLPAGSGGFGHPVLSIYQADIIIYGTDLAAYIDREFGGREDIPVALSRPGCPRCRSGAEFL